MKKSIFFIIVYLLSKSITAQESNNVIVLNREDELLKIGLKTYFLEDKEGRLTIEEILKTEQQAKFQRNSKEVFTRPSSTSAYWFRFTFQNKTKAIAWLSLATTYISYIDFYAPDSLGIYDKPLLTGAIRSPRNKAYPINNYWLPLPHYQALTYYMRIKALGVVEAPLRIGTLSALYQEKEGYDFYAAGFAGAMIIIFFYNLFLFFSTWEKLYLIYLAYLLFALFTGLLMNNYPFLEPLLQNNYWHRYILFLHSPLYIFIVWFVIIYLDIKKKMTRIYLPLLTFLTMIILSSVGAALTTEDYYYLFYNAFQLFVALLTIIGLYIGFYLSIRKDKPALFFLVGWSFLIFGTIIYLLTVNGLLVYNVFTRNVLYLGMAAEACMFSLALGYRFNLIQVRSVQVQQQNEELDQMNEELRVKSEQLVYANQTKDKLFSILSHDLRSPFASFISVLDLWDSNLLSHTEQNIIIGELKKSTNAVYDTLENLLIWSKSQLQGIKTEPQKVDIQLIVQDKANLFRKQLNSKHLLFVNEVPPACFVYADENHVGIILRNLIGNAIKFTPENGKITIHSTESEGFIKISVTDTGVGMTPDAMQGLFHIEDVSTQLGTGGEVGTGLGLLLCKEFIEKNNGKIGVESILSKGSTFYFTLPKPSKDYPAS